MMMFLFTSTLNQKKCSVVSLFKAVKLCIFSYTLPIKKTAKNPISECHRGIGESERMRPYHESDITGYNHGFYAYNTSYIKKTSRNKMRRDNLENGIRQNLPAKVLFSVL